MTPPTNFQNLVGLKMSFSIVLASMHFPTANIPRRILRPVTARGLGLQNLDPRLPTMNIPIGRHRYEPAFSRHALRRVPHPLNWSPVPRTFDSNNPNFYPSELRVPIYLYSFETILFLGFSYETAVSLWTRFTAKTTTTNNNATHCDGINNIDTNEGGMFGFPKYLIAYLQGQGVVDGIEKYQEVKRLSGYDPRGTSYGGFGPGVKELESVDPELPLTAAHDDDDEQRRRIYGSSTTTKLHHWVYMTIFNRFAFLAMLTYLFEAIDDPQWTDLEDPEPLAMWKGAIHSLQQLAFLHGVFPD